MSTYTGSPEYLYTPQPEPGELISQIIGLGGVTIMSVLFGIKTYNIQYRYLTYSKWLVLSLYFCSWAFTVSGLNLVFTNNGNYMSCLLSILACDIFYSGTKIIIYCWLIEKVWVVNAGRTSRWQTKSYRFHMLLLVPYIGIFILMLLFHNAWLEKDGSCTIGLQLPATIPLVTYDFLINLYMTILFVRPLLKLDKVSNNNKDHQAERLKDVARRTMVASVVCLIVSFANIGSLAILKGVERGAICLTCCYTDVVINVITVHWVTSQRKNKTIRDTTNKSNYPKGSTLTSNNSQIQSPSIDDNKNSKKPKFDFEDLNEQYGRFGDNNSSTTTHQKWSSYLNDYSNDGYAPTHYMSAMNTKITTLPIHQEFSNNNNMMSSSYQVKHDSHQVNSSTPIRHYTNGKYIVMTEKDDDDFQTRSRSSSIQESYSSKHSLTKPNLDM
ncbi:hypothetical protein BJ944DRAFT_258375 [Cunninghamella echinulata]|nr:hypothetical protein BJ944DRAFT_258375 [Cunninghamella echinulata]